MKTGVLRGKLGVHCLNKLSRNGQSSINRTVDRRTRMLINNEIDKIYVDIGRRFCHLHGAMVVYLCRAFQEEAPGDADCEVCATSLVYGASTAKFTPRLLEHAIPIYVVRNVAGRDQKMPAYFSWEEGERQGQKQCGMKWRR